MLRKSLAVFCAAMTWVGPASAVTVSDFNTAVSQLQTDTELLSSWQNGQFKNAVAFNSTAGAVIPKQLKVFGIEFGIEGVVTGTKMDVDGLHRLGTTIVDTRDIDVYERMPMPAIIAHAKIGLPFGLDAGIRAGGIPKTDVDNDDTQIEVKNSIFGVDVRKKLIEEGVAKPFGLTLGANYTHAKGHIDATSPIESLSGPTVSNGGLTFNSSLNATGHDRTDWSTNSFGIQAIVNKQMLFFNPYIGAAANKNWGSVNSTIDTSGSVTLTEQGNSSNTANQTFTTRAAKSDKPNSVDLRGLFGFELSILPFMRLGAYGEYAGSRNLAGSLGLRFQFR